jgi:hypothetical protein
MSSEGSQESLVRLTHGLCALPRETEQLQLEPGAIVPAVPGAATKLLRYLPFWASTSREGRA